MFIRKEPKFFTLFNRQADNMYTAARYFNELVITGNFNEETVAQMHRIEHEGDIVCREVSDMLNRTFITPFDREDIFELSNNIDNVVDAINSITKRMGLYKLTTPDGIMKQFSAIIEECTLYLSDAIKHLDNMKNTTRIQAHCSDVNRLENQGDKLRDQAIVELFEKSSDPIYILKWKEVYETVENAVDICDHVGKTIYSITVKHG